ncbi:DUF3017 domain-containing protein [Streptomyces sp. NBC_01216]|uniref:DUF3017 domain-containing protein n=1 Tax=unclassified Streptomyces TaxID=2593676 RepID=UPI002E0E9CEB|nr:DUF3017 domain-containing protein [Streptomyces sp. NBC_01216]
MPAPGASGADEPETGRAAGAGGPEVAAGRPAVAANGRAADDAPPPADATRPAAERATVPTGAPGTTADDPGSTPRGDDPTGSGARGRSRRPPTVTTGTARPEGGGRAAPGDAPAPARQWPLLTVLGLAGLGLLIVGTDLFPQSFRVGTILVGVALLTGAALRRALPSVGMLAVRSRFTDLVTYGLMGTLIVLLALMVQPDPWLQIPFLEDVLHLTVT